MSTYGLNLDEVREWVEEKMSERKLTHQQLAKMTEVGDSTLRRALRGKARNGSPTEHNATLAKVVRALGGTLVFEYDILEGVDQ